MKVFLYIFTLLVAGLIFFSGYAVYKAKNTYYEVNVYQGHNDFKLYTQYKCNKMSSPLYFQDCVNSNDKRKVSHLRLPISKMIEVNKKEVK